MGSHKLVCRVMWLIGQAGIERLKSVTKWLFGIDVRWGFALMLLFVTEGNPWSEKRVCQLVLGKVMNEVKAESRNEENTAHWYADRLMITDKGVVLLRTGKGVVLMEKKKVIKTRPCDVRNVVSVSERG